jgi:hypothetical protein
MGHVGYKHMIQCDRTIYITEVEFLKLFALYRKKDLYSFYDFIAWRVVANVSPNVDRAQCAEKLREFWLSMRNKAGLKTNPTNAELRGHINMIFFMAVRFDEFYLPKDQSL